MYFAASVFAIGEPFLAKYISDPNFQRSGDSRKRGGCMSVAGPSQDANSTPLGQRSGDSRKRGGCMSVAGPSQDANSAPFGGSAAAIAASVGVVV